jgi:hypothetical protein
MTMVTGMPRGTTADSRGQGGSGGAGRLPGPAGGWTAARVVTLVIGSLPALVSLGLVGGGALSAALIWIPARLAAGAGWQRWTGCW